MTFTVSIDQELGSDLTFDYQSVDVSALAGSDYVAISGAGTIAAGDTSATIMVTVNSDANVFEGDETFTLDLSNFNQTVNFQSGAHLTADGVQGIGTIGADNGPPDAVDDAFVTAPDTALVTGNVLANDILVDNAAYDSHSGTAVPGSTVSYNGDGTFTYTPAAGFTGTDTFTYTLIDDDGETDTATVTINVTSAAVTPPVVSAVPDTTYTENDVPVSLLTGTSLSDADSSSLSSVVVTMNGFIPSQDVLNFLTAGTSVSASVSTSGSTWELTLTGGVDINEYETVLNTLTYENSSENPSTAARPITVEAFDEEYNNLSNSDSGSLTIIAENDAPVVFDNDGFYVADSLDNGLNITVPTDPDTDDSTLVITVTGLPGSIGTITLADGTPVNIGDTLTAADLEDLQFDAGSDDGEGQFTYSVYDGELTTTGTTTINVGSTDPDAGTVYESALADGTGSDSGAATVSGNLFDNDAAAGSSIDSVDFGATNNTPTAGVITITTTIGTLTVYADDSTPGFSAGDYIYELNSAYANPLEPDPDHENVKEEFTYNFTNGMVLSDTLTITIVDDKPVANDLVETIPESEEQIFNLLFTLDDSGSMAWGAETGSDPPGVGEASRMEIAKEALEALAQEYFDQSTQVSLTLITFNSSASFVGTYSNYADFQAGLSGVTPGGGTNYVDATDEIMTQMTADLAVQDPTDDVQNISYFISDGEPNAGTSSIGSGYIEFANNNSIDSYAVGIGSSLPADLSDLNYIHNIDSMGQGNGHVDEALIVADVSELESELLSTVPTAFGGNITLNGSIPNVLFGADDGHVSSITLELNDVSETFTYDGSTIAMPPEPLASTVDIDGSKLTLNADDGFDYGTFTFDFSDGSYLFIAPNGTAGSTFNFDYAIIDGDGDTAAATATVNIVDDKPDARDDLHTVDPFEIAEGNVITAMGTDAGPKLGADYTPFATQGGGVDKIVDDAVVTEFTYKESSIDLDLTLSTNTIPAPPPTGGSENVAINSFTDWSTTNVTLSANAGFNDDGAGIENSRIDTGDSGALIVSFDTTELLYGVNNLMLTLSDFQSGNNDVITITVYDTNGDTLDTVIHPASSGTSVDLSAYTGIGSVGIVQSGGWDSQLANVAFDPHAPATIDVTTIDQGNGDNGSNLSWVYSYETDIDGNDIFQATVTDSDDGSVFIMRSNGYYNYAPDQSGLPDTYSVDVTSDVAATDGGLVLSSPDGSVYYSTDGAGVQGGGIDDRLDVFGTDGGPEVLVVTFDSGTSPLGVNGIQLTLTSWAAGESITIDVFDTSGTLIADDVYFDTANPDLSAYNNVGRIEITAASDGTGTGGNTNRATYVRLLTVDYVTEVPTNADPILVDYMLTDTDGQSDIAQLAIHTIDNIIEGTVGADNIAGGADNDAITGNDGDDILSGNGGHDSIAGGAGQDTLYGNDGSDYLSGGDDADELYGGAGDDHLAGDGGDDLLDGGTGGDILLGGDGSDALYGGSGNDKLSGDVGDDQLYGGTGDDVLEGGDGDDTLDGSSGIDTLDGGQGNDTLTGGTGNDILVGGEGNDILVGGEGDDILAGGIGSDTYEWNAGDQGTVGNPAIDTIENFDNGLGGDILDLRDLLQGEEEISNPLTDYLNFTSDGIDTTIHIDHDGSGLFEETQEIVIKGVDLTAGGTVADQDIISDLIANNNLIIDS
ncbi:MAG: type I secretion C-terminal target domain-containing protein [Desulfobacteraceae bacterium]|nr:type I secretion C-terminal target domain-containing protein [Desulfobacteraceae bacterium]